VSVPIGSSFLECLPNIDPLVPTRRLCITSTGQILPSDRIQAISPLPLVSRAPSPRSKIHAAPPENFPVFTDYLSSFNHYPFPGHATPRKAPRFPRDSHLLKLPSTTTHGLFSILRTRSPALATTHSTQLSTHSARPQQYHPLTQVVPRRSCGASYM
jgi:hypothetical protein